MLRRLRLGPFDEHSAFVTEYVTLRLPSFPAAFDGFRVALLADVHLGPFVRGGYLRRVIDETLRRAPNLVVLAGDMADRCPSDRRRFARLIEPLARAAPTVAVWGNHDYYFRWPGFARRLAAAGVDVLVNRCRLLCRGGEGVALVGLDDLTRGGPDPAAAMATVPTGAFVIAVAHNPDLADAIGPSRTGLMLCGHTHGGQIRLFGRAMVTHVRNPRYVSGLVEGPGFPMYISRGLGLGGLPIRYGADPELTILTLRS